MIQIKINPFEKVGSTDVNSLQFAVHKSLFDDVLYQLFGKQNGTLNGAFAPTYLSATTARLAAGTLLMFDSSQTGVNPQYRMIKATAVVPLTFAAADGSHDRIDLVCLAPNFVVTSQASRYVKTGGVGPVVLTNVDKVLNDSYTLQVVTGTPSSSPAVPALPSGYIAVMQAYIHQTTGLTGQSDLTNLMTTLTPPALNTANQRWVSPSGLGTDTTLAAAIAALPSGGLIWVVESLSLGSSGLAIGTNNIEIRCLPQATISGTATGLTLNASGIRIKGRFTGFTTAISISNGASYSFVTECRFGSCTNDVVDNNTTPNAIINNNISE
jgi:hypothetical protein